MDESVAVPRTSEGLSVSSLSDVGEHIAIAEHMPSEHEANAGVFHSGEDTFSETFSKRMPVFSTRARIHFQKHFRLHPGSG